MLCIGLVYESVERKTVWSFREIDLRQMTSDSPDLEFPHFLYAIPNNDYQLISRASNEDHGVSTFIIMTFRPGSSDIR